MLGRESCMLLLSKRKTFTSALLFSFNHMQELSLTIFIIAFDIIPSQLLSKVLRKNIRVKISCHKLASDFSKKLRRN